MDGSSQNDNVSICRMMHLLDQDDCQIINRAPQVIKDVYGNFTSMLDVAKGAKRKYKAENKPKVMNEDEDEDYYEIKDTHFDLSFLVGVQKDLIAHIRWALKWCVSDVGVINRKLFDLLVRTETHFIEVLQLLLSAQPLENDWAFHDNITRKAGDLRCMEQKILNAYRSFEKACKPSMFILSEELVLERLDKVINKDETFFGRIQKRHKNQCILLKRLIHDNSAEHGRWKSLFPWVELVLDDMSFLEFISWRENFSKITKQRIAAAIQTEILQIFVWQPDSSPSFTDELLVAYVDCIQKNLIWILKEVDYSLTEHAKDQFKVIRDVLRFVLSLFSDMAKHEIARTELSPTKMYVETELIRLGCVLSSFFAKEFDKNKVSFEISNWLGRVFRALLLPLEFDGFLSNETLIGYACCCQHYWFQMPTNKDTDMKSQFPLVFIARVVFYEWSEYHIEREMLLDGRMEMVDVLRDLGSVICKSLNNVIEGNVVPMAMNPALDDLLAKFEHVKIHFTRTLTLTMFKELSLQNPETDLIGFLNFLHGHLEELRICNLNLVKELKDQLQIIQEHLVVFRLFLQNSRDNGFKDDSLQDVTMRIRNAAYSAEYIINGVAAGAFHVCCRSFLVSDVIEQSNQINEIIVKGSSDVSFKKLLEPANDGKKYGIRISSRASVPPTDVVVGFEVEINLLMERLASDKRQLDVIPVVGMPGLGKTTLAKKVYEDPYITNHFQLRAWCTVSQDYVKEDLLRSILGTGGSRETSCEQLSLMVHQKLTGRKYLIVLDDVWDIDVFEYLYRFFPNNDNGSRIVLTSRIQSMGNQSNPLVLHLLSDDESWNMLKQKVYPKEECPLELIQIGKEIARKCGGLSLAVSVVAGILAKSEKEQDAWKEIAERLIIYSADGSQGDGMKALDLSYELLPDHLKPLFLYVGAFPEDYSIPAEKLKWLWIAEGFVRETKFSSLEAQAEAYLMDLIDRSLLMVAKRKSNGSVKSCSIHDLMRDMTLSKAKEESFLQRIESIDKTIHIPEHLMCQRRVSASVMMSKDIGTLTSARPPITYEDLSRVSMSSRVNSIILFDMGFTYSSDTKSIFTNHKMLRVLDADRLELGQSSFTNETVPLHLRYISFYMRSNRIPPSVFSPWNLEILTINSQGEIKIPMEVWDMVKLRHLHVGHSARFTYPENDLSKLENLQTLSRPNFSEEEMNLIGRFPNVQRLSCVFSDGKKEISELPSILGSLHQLESLKMLWHAKLPCSAQFNLPSTLKQLSLNYFRLKWNDISRFQVLPNLEVLKLKNRAVRYNQDLWNMGDGEFPRLKFLKLDGLSIKQWIAGAENFPCLQNLVLDTCVQLEEIPSSFGDICSLEKIHLHRCSHSSSESAKLIREEQEEFGNDLLKIYISDPFPPKDDETSDGSDYKFRYELADEPGIISADELGDKLEGEFGNESDDGLGDIPDNEPDYESGEELLDELEDGPDNESGEELLDELEDGPDNESGGEWDDEPDNEFCGESSGEWDDESDDESLD